jgi:ATP-dependent RNA helicase RhlE
MTPTPSEETPVSGFLGLGIAPKLLEALARNNYVTPTPIQKQSIPVAIEGKDMVGIAQTGTGKTLAFGIPMIQRIARMGGKGLALLPTRELALQVEEQFQKIGRGAGLRTAILIGGAAMGPQIAAIRNKPHIIIATPGRLIDHMEQKIVKLDDVSVLVLDEADRMLDMGFLPQINRILREIPKTHQTMLFSATMPREIVEIAQRFMTSPTRIEIATSGTLAENVDQELYVVRKEHKVRLLEKLLEEHKGSVLVFTRTKFGARRLAHEVVRMGHPAADIHSDRSLAQRREALDGFKSGKYRVLVATDIAARGIDVTGIEMVVNFDVPENPEDYVHRIGRTGRAGMSGIAVTFAMPDQGSEVRDIERLIRKVLEISPMPTDLPPERPRPPMSQSAERPQYQQRGGYQGGRRQGSSGSHSGGRTPSYGDTRKKAPHADGRVASYGDTRKSSTPGDTRQPHQISHRPSAPARQEPRPAAHQEGPVKSHDRRIPAGSFEASQPTNHGVGVPGKDRAYLPGLDDGIKNALGGLWPGDSSNAMKSVQTPAPRHQEHHRKPETGKRFPSRHK